jgi:hypothetical protein
MDQRTFNFLNKLNKRIPKKLLSAVVEKKALSPTVKQIAELAQTDPDISQEKKDAMALLLKVGMFDLEIEEVNREAEKKIEEWMGKEIDKAIKKGQIPPPEADEFTKNIRAKWQTKK